MKMQISNINMVRSAWRRVKKDIKDAIIRDLKPVKDVKGGGVTGESKPTTDRGAPRGLQAAIVRVREISRLPPPRLITCHTSRGVVVDVYLLDEAP